VDVTTRPNTPIAATEERKRARFRRAVRKGGDQVVSRRVSSQSPRTVLYMSAIATLRVLCDTSPSIGTAIVNGLLAWAAALGGFTVLFSGMPAAVALFIPSRPETLARRINRGLGQGVVLGMMLGPLTLFVFIDKVIS
jgi:hypothetical protein